MNGFAFILETYGVKQATIAEMLNVSRVTINYWLHGKKTIPEKRAKQLIALPIFEGLKYEYFMKESLSPSERLDIEVMKMHHESEAIEIEDSHIDEKGIEHKYKRISYTNENEIHFLTKERDRIKETEQLIKTINFLLINHHDDNDDFGFSFDHGSVMSTLQNVVTILQGKREHNIALKVLLEVLIFDNSGFGKPYFSVYEKNQKEFAKKLVKLLEEYKLVDNEFLKE